MFLMILRYILPVFLFSFISLFSEEKPLKIENYIHVIPTQEHLSNYTKLIPALLYSDDVIRILCIKDISFQS